MLENSRILNRFAGGMSSIENPFRLYYKESYFARLLARHSPYCLLLEFLIAALGTAVLLYGVTGTFSSLAYLLLLVGVLLAVVRLKLPAADILRAFQTSRLLAQIKFSHGFSSAEPGRARGGEFVGRWLVILVGVILGALIFLNPLIFSFRLVTVLVFAGVSFYRPVAGICLFAMLFPFLPDELLFIAIGLVGLAALMRNGGEFAAWMKKIPVLPQMVVYMAVLLIWTFFSIDIIGSFRDLFIYFFAFVMFFAVVAEVNTKERLNKVCLFLLVGGLFVSLYGVYQYITGVPMEPGWIDEALYPGIRTRVYAVFGNPNILVQYLTFLIPFGLGISYTYQDQRKYWFGGIVLLLLLCALLTFSRSGLVAVGFVIAFYALFNRQRIYILLMLVMFAGAILANPDILTRLVSLLDFEHIYRFTLWEYVATMIMDAPVTGYGLGHIPFREAFFQYYTVIDLYHAHNTFFQLWAETGIIGMFVFLWFFVSLNRTGFSAWLNSDDTYLQTIILSCLTGLLGVVMVIGIGETVFYMPKVIVQFWLVVGLLIAAINLARPGEPAHHSERNR